MRATMNRSILVLLVLFLSVCYGYHGSNRYGILYINEILANSDTHTVQIEQSIVQENQITTDKIEEWTGNGIIVEEVFIKDENVELFNDFYVLPRVIFPGRCDFNGGLVSDSPYVDLFSFHIIDDTGDTSLRGTLYPGKGLNVNEGAFVIVDGSAETRIRDQLLHANGGINVLDGNFIVDGVTGDISNKEITHVVGDIYVGTSEDNAPRYVARQATTNLIGKDAYLIAQDGALTGGDIIVLPGVGSERNGNIFFGREGFGDHIVVTRQLEFSTDTGGDTFIQAQDSLIGAGGDFYLIGGDSTDNGSGGNIVLSPGVSDQGGQGQIYFGTTVQELAAFDMYIARPILDGGNGGDTFLRGQSTENGDAGNLQVRAGTIPENADSFGGDLHISPGLDENENHGIIYIGANKASDLIITRYTIPSLGGATLLRGQPSSDGNGGDLYLWAGDSGGNANGGDIYFVPGTTPVTNNGDIYLGLQTDTIEIERPVQNNPLFVTGSATSISGQDSAGAGGDLNLFGGDGSDGGDIFLEAGDGFSDPGGNLNIAAGYGNAFGGDVIIDAASTNGIGGDVIFDAGEGNGGRGGDIFLNPGSGFTNGVVTFGPVASIVDITGTAVLAVENSFVTLLSAANQLQLQPVSDRILVHNGLQLLRTKSDVFVIDVDTTPVTTANQYERVRELQSTLNALINSLAQCQHGLFQTITTSGSPRDCADYS